MKGALHTLKKPASFIGRGRVFYYACLCLSGGKGMRVLLTAGSHYFFGFGKVKEEMSGMRVIRAIT